MLAYLKTKAADALAWIYKWVTVLTGLAVACLSVIPALLNTLSLIDLSPLFGAERAAQVMAGVAILKAVIEVSRASQAKKAD